MAYLCKKNKKRHEANPHHPVLLPPDAGSLRSRRKAAHTERRRDGHVPRGEHLRSHPHPRRRRALLADERRRDADHQILVQDRTAGGSAVRRHHRPRVPLQALRQLQLLARRLDAAHRHRDDAHLPPLVHGRALPVQPEAQPRGKNQQRGGEALGRRTATGARLLAGRLDDCLRTRQQHLPGEALLRQQREPGDQGRRTQQGHLRHARLGVRRGVLLQPRPGVQRRQQDAGLRALGREPGEVLFLPRLCRRQAPHCGLREVSRHV